MNTELLIKINQIVSQYGGTFGVRDITLIESALGRGEMAENYGQDRIGSVFESLIKNHPFIDGNKRTAVVFLIYSLSQKNLNYICDYWYLAKLVDNLASNKITIEEAMDNIYSHSQIVSNPKDIESILETELVKSTLDILARKDSNELTNSEKEWFDR